MLETTVRTAGKRFCRERVSLSSAYVRIDDVVVQHAANGIGPMPPGIADREVKYLITFPNFDDVIRVFGDYEIVIAMQSPSSSYNVRGQHVQGIRLFFRVERNRQNMSRFAPDRQSRRREMTISAKFIRLRGRRGGRCVNSAPLSP
jgi:hypothetical protein